jgi:hypothetical protein
VERKIPANGAASRQASGDESIQAGDESCGQVKGVEKTGCNLAGTFSGRAGLVCNG